MKVAFFQCDKCHEWRYSTKSLATTRKYKCIRCNHQINLDVVVTEVYNMPNRPELKIKTLKEIKMRGRSDVIEFE